MTTPVLAPETYLPEADGHDLARIFDFLTAHETVDNGAAAPRYLLAGATPGDEVELPAEVHRILRQVIEAMRGGLAVTVVPQTLTLTTQQGADLLGISRPTLTKLLDAGRIPFERVGTHRRIQLPDLLSYRDERRQEQYRALEATAVSIDDEEDLQEALANLRQARREMAARRRKQPST